MQTLWLCASQHRHRHGCRPAISSRNCVKIHWGIPTHYSGPAFVPCTPAGNTGMRMHLANTHIVGSSCPFGQIERRPVSIRCPSFASSAQQRLHQKRSHACTVSCSAATQQQPKMGAEQSRTPNNASGAHETDFVVIGSGIGGRL